MDGIETPSLPEAIEEMITAYHEVNGPIETYNYNPSSSVYARHIAKNRPFLIRNGCSNWDAARWNVDYLQEKMGARTVRIAETPFG